MTIDERTGVTVAQVAALQPEPVYRVVPDIQIGGVTFHPEKLGIPRNEDGTWQAEVSNAEVAAATEAVRPENSLNNTVRNPDWIAANREKLRELFPETFTHPTNINFLPIRFNLKLLGVDWRTDEQFAQCLAALETANIINRDGVLIRRGY